MFKAIFLLAAIFALVVSAQNGTDVAFTVDETVTNTSLIHEIYDKVPGALGTSIVWVSDSNNTGTFKAVSPQLRAVLAAVGASDYTITLNFEDATVAATTILYANNGTLTGVSGATIVTPTGSDDDDNKTKIIIGVCVGVGGLILILAIIFVIKKKSVDGDGDYVAMNKKNSEIA